jgi:hypothetical protein
MFKPGAAIFVLAAIALLFWLTWTEEQEDPCADPQRDVSAAVLADDAGDQDALANRAIIQRGGCEED